MHTAARIRRARRKEKERAPERGANLVENRRRNLEERKEKEKVRIETAADLKVAALG